MGLGKLVVVVTILLAAVSLSGCVSERPAPLSPQPPVQAPAGTPPCGSPEEDYLAFLTGCDVTAPSLERLGEEMGLQFYAPEIDVSNNDPDLFGAAAFGNKCVLQIRFSGEGVIDESGVVEKFYDGLLMKRQLDGYMVFVTDDPAPPADIVVALQDYVSECA